MQPQHGSASVARSGESERGTLAARLRVWAPALSLVLLGVLTYVDRLSGPFIFDDEHAIVHNPSLVPFELGRALRPPSESPVAARPLVNLSFAIDRSVFGLSPTAFHASNLSLHVACALVAFAALRRLLALCPLRAQPELPAFVAAAFCVHPMAAEVVLYTTQRSELLVALCYLGALWLLLREAQTGVRSWPWVLLLGLCGAASKEVFVSAPLVLLACDRAFCAGSFRAALRERGAFHAALALSLVPLLCLQLGAPRSESVRLLELDYLLAQARIVPGYVLHALWPARPVLDYGPLWPGTYASAWPWLALGCAALALSGVWVWRWPRSGFTALWTLAILAPTSSVLSIHTEVGAERRFYLPLIAVLGAVSVLASALLERGLRVRQRAALLGLGAAAVVTLALATRQHALDYRDTRAFWHAAARGNPDNARAHYNLAETLRREGDGAGAIESLRRALQARPAYADAHINLSGLLIASGALADGLAHAERGAALEPKSPNAHYNLALACAFSGQTERALAELETTVRLQPQHTEARRRLAQGYLALGRSEQARAHARRLLQYAPGDPLALRVLGR